MVKQFIQNFREAFGQKATLPLLFGYSNQPVADTERINGCFFKGLQAAREGAPVSFGDSCFYCCTILAPFLHHLSAPPSTMFHSFDEIL